MGLFDILRGERRPKRANLDALFAMTTAYDTLTVNLGLEAVPRAAVCFKPVEAGAFTELLRDLDELLQISGKSTGTGVEQHQDEFGFRWVVLTDASFEDLVTTTHLVNQTIEERGFGEQLLCSVFAFRDPGPGGGALYFVYSYKRGTYYPFAPRDGQKRDTAAELRYQAALMHELPLERELERWYPIWGVPV